jgi:hypothetical protein
MKTKGISTKTYLKHNKETKQVSICYGLSMKCLLQAHVFNIWSLAGDTIQEVLATLGGGI